MNDEWMIGLTREEIIDTMVAITSYMKTIDHSHKNYDGFIKLFFKFNNFSDVIANKGPSFG